MPVVGQALGLRRLSGRHLLGTRGQTSRAPRASEGSITPIHSSRQSSRAPFEGSVVRLPGPWRLAPGPFFRASHALPTGEFLHRLSFLPFRFPADVPCAVYFVVKSSGFCHRKPGHETRTSTRVTVAFSVNREPGASGADEPRVASVTAPRSLRQWVPRPLALVRAEGHSRQCEPTPLRANKRLRLSRNKTAARLSRGLTTSGSALPK